MLIRNNTLYRIEPEDVIDGVFISPDEVLYVDDGLECDNVNKIILPNVIKIGNRFLYRNDSLIYLDAPKVEVIGNDFLLYNTCITTLKIPNINIIGYNFLWSANYMDYTPRVVNSLKGNLYVCKKTVDKKKYIRKSRINKILC